MIKSFSLCGSKNFLQSFPVLMEYWAITLARDTATLVEQETNPTISTAIMMFYVMSVEELHQRLLRLAHVKNPSFLLVNMGTVYNDPLNMFSQQHPYGSQYLIRKEQKNIEDNIILD